MMNDMTMYDPDQNPVPLFTPQEMHTLQALHTQYQDDHDRFSDRERARLRFLRWLYDAGNLDSEPTSLAPRRHGSDSQTDGKIDES